MTFVNRYIGFYINHFKRSFRQWFPIAKVIFCEKCVINDVLYVGRYLSRSQWTWTRTQTSPSTRLRARATARRTSSKIYRTSKSKYTWKKYWALKVEYILKILQKYVLLEYLSIGFKNEYNKYVIFQIVLTFIYYLKYCKEFTST